MPHRQIYKVRSPITCDVREKQRPQREDAMEVTQKSRSEKAVFVAFCTQQGSDGLPK